MSDRSGRALPGHQRGAFTLVELLIVVGIIALLVSIVLAVTSRARDAAARVACSSNLRQLGSAFLMYANENDFVLPYVAAFPDGLDLKEDWVHWQGTAAPEVVVNNSAIAPYLGAKGAAVRTLLRCPADTDADQRPYPYSYVLNYLLSSQTAWSGLSSSPTLRTIKRHGQKILMAEENERTINDGLWAPGNYADAGRTNWVVQWDWLSIRHDTHKKEYRQPVVGTLYEQQRRGHALFLDGRVDYVTRQFAHSPQHLMPSNEGTGKVPAEPAS